MKNKRPAPPYMHSHVGETNIQGMTYREWLAGLAMQGILTKYNMDSNKASAELAEASILIADALIKALETPQEG